MLRVIIIFTWYEFDIFNMSNWNNTFSWILHSNNFSLKLLYKGWYILRNGFGIKELEINYFFEGRFKLFCPILFLKILFNPFVAETSEYDIYLYWRCVVDTFLNITGI